MRKRITSALLTLVMLLSLIPAMGTTASAAGTTNEYLYINREYKLDNGKYITKDAPNAPKDFNGQESSLPSDKTYAALLDDTLYLKGDWDGSVGIYGAMSVKRWLTNPLTIVVMGDTTIKRLELFWSNTVKENSGVTIDLRNNATLNITYATNGKGMSAIDAVYSKGDSSGWFGAAVTVKGTGTLKTDAIAPNWHQEPFVKAGAFSITENVNLDTKLAYNGTWDDPFYVYSLDKFVVDTTGYVKIDTFGYANALMLPAVMNRYQLKNASSITLTASAKDKMFDSGDAKSVGYFITDCCTGWKVNKPDDDNEKPYTLKLTRDTMPTAAELTVGAQTVQNTADTPVPSVTVTGGEYVSLTASVTLPTWLSNMVTGSNARAKVGDWFLRIFEGEKLVGETIGGYNNSINVNNLPEVSIGTTGFKPEAGKTYTVYACIPIVTVNGGKQLGSASVIATIKAVEKPDTVITSVKLTGDALTEGATAGPTLTKASSDTGYTVGTTNWNITGSVAAGKEYYTTLTLTAADGYVFPTNWSQLRNIISVKLGDTAITKLGLGLSDGGKTLSLTVYATADHNHSWGEWQKDADGHYRKCSTCNTVSDKEAHNWGEWMNSGTEGEAIRTCSTCGYSETRTSGERPISFLKINIIRPVAGATPAASDLTIRDAYVDQVEIVPNSVGWYDESGNLVTGTFEKGKSYTIKAQFTPKGERIFADTITTAGTFFTTDETKTLSADKKTVDYSCTFTAYESTTVNTALPTLKVGEVMPLPTVPDGRTYTVNVLYSAGAGSLLSLSYDSTESKWKSGSADATEEELKVKADTVYVYSYTIKEGDNEKVTAILTGTGNSITSDATGNWVTASYDTSSMNKIASVDLTVTAPMYGATPATNATVPTGANYSTGTPEWSPAVTDGKFGADTYTVSIPVTLATGYSFAEGCVYTVNGYTAAYADGKVSYTFPALTAPHTHTYGAWAKLDDSYHSRTCNAGDDIQVEAHTWGNWATVDGNTHKRTCNDCGAEQTANHDWVFHSQTDATFDAPGKTVYKCADNCGVANKEEPIAQLVKIDVANLTVAKPVKGAAATEASTTDTAYYVAATEWVAADGTPLAIGGTFQLGTAYTVKITLETAGDGVFSAASAYNQIAGKTATVSPALTGDGYTDTVILTYTFDATAEASPTEYAITVTNGKATVGAGTPISKATEGTTITLTADAAPSGKVFDKWVVESGSITLANASSATTTFTMPAGAVSVKATYKAAPVATYNLTTQVNGGNGSISASKTGLTAGSTETVVFTPDSGYEIDTVTVNGVTIPVLSNVLDVTMDSDKTVIVTYKAIGGSEHSHSYGSEWKNDADNHWHECSCGDKTDVAAHSFKWVVDKEATATEKGSKHEECKVCGYKKDAVEIPATGTSTTPTTPTEPNKPADTKSPQTGDNSNMILWITLLFVSGGVLAGTTLYSRKRKSVK